MIYLLHHLIALLLGAGLILILVRGRWPDRTPGRTIAVWHCALLTVWGATAGMIFGPLVIIHDRGIVPALIETTGMIFSSAPAPDRLGQARDRPARSDLRPRQRRRAGRRVGPDDPGPASASAAARSRRRSDPARPGDPDRQPHSGRLVPARLAPADRDHLGDGRAAHSGRVARRGPARAGPSPAAARPRAAPVPDAAGPAAAQRPRRRDAPPRPPADRDAGR